MNKEIAKQSLDAILSKSRILDKVQKDDLSHNPIIIQALILFAEVLKEQASNSRFVIRDICNWSVTYMEQSGEELPYILSNSYSLGKFIKTYSEQLPFEYLGTYGNRAVYKVKETIDD